MKQTNMIVDLSVLLWLTRFSNLKKNIREDKAKELIIQETIKAIEHSVEKFGVGGLLIACDGSNYWRRDIYSYYKMNRMTKSDIYYADVKQAGDDIIDFFNKVTDVPAIKVDRCEGDDIIKVARDMSSAKSLILSSDKDFVQLIDNTTRLFSPVQYEERYEESPEYSLFEKCIRGDNGDNIMSAYPRIQTKKLKEAWEDPYQMTQIMEHTFNKDGKIHKVADRYNFNRSLIDLNQIPTDIVNYIMDEIREQSNRNNTYSKMRILNYLGKLGMKDFAKNIERHTPLFKMRFIQ